MSMLRSFKNIGRTAFAVIGFIGVAAKTLGEAKQILGDIYKLFSSSDDEKNNKDELLSQSFSLKQISEEIMIFKDDNGEMKTVISRKIQTRSSLPDKEVANDNDNNADYDQQPSHIRDLATSICQGNNSRDCNKLLGLIDSEPPDINAAA